MHNSGRGRGRVALRIAYVALALMGVTGALLTWMLTATSGGVVIGIMAVVTAIALATYDFATNRTES